MAKRLATFWVDPRVESPKMSPDQGEQLQAQQTRLTVDGVPLKNEVPDAETEPTMPSYART